MHPRELEEEGAFKTDFFGSEVKEGDYDELETEGLAGFSIKEEGDEDLLSDDEEDSLLDDEDDEVKDSPTREGEEGLF